MEYTKIFNNVISGDVFGLPQSTDWLYMDLNGTIKDTNENVYVIERWMYEEDNWQLKTRLPEDIDEGCICYDDGQIIDYKSNCTIHGKDKTNPTGERPRAPDMPEPKERRSTDLDPDKKFQCEMAERIFYSLKPGIYLPEEIMDANGLSNKIAQDIYNHFFK